MSKSRFVAVPLCAAAFAAVLTAQTSYQGPATPKVDYARDVQPILHQNCYECHGPDKQRAGMRLDRKSSVFKTFSRRVVPGNSANSMVYHRLSDDQFGQPMPPSGELKPELVAIIKAWIDQGAEWPDALANEVDRPPFNPKAVAMVEALRSNDLAAFLKSAAADPFLLNARGPEGSTPFMYAVLYANVPTLTRLLKMGADANKRNDANATALMWAATSLEKTRLLLDHGADVNAKSDDIRTPLMVAARRPGSLAIVKLLLDHGANPNPNARPETESSPLIEALTAGDADTVQLLVQRGADAKITGEMGLTTAIQNKCDKCVDLLAAAITEKSVYTASLQDTAVYGDLRSVRMMLDHGANANAYDLLGRTPLMYAAVSDGLPLDVVKALVEHGADVNAKDRHAKTEDEGETILDIARRNGDTPIVHFLLASGAKPGTGVPETLHPRRENDLRRAIQDSLPLLQRADKSFVVNTGCISCHNNSLTAMTMGLTRKREFQIDEKSDAEQVQANVDILASTRDRMRQGNMFGVGDNFGEGVIAYQLMGLYAEGYKPDLSTDAAAMFILARQHANGEWMAQHADARPPLCLDYIGQTVRSMRALQLYAPKTEAAEYQRAVRLAASWVATAHSYNNDDRSWRVAGLAWAGASKAALQSAILELRAAQKPDGGWSDEPAMASDAYATGKSLVALNIAGVPTSDPAFLHGIKYLLSTQQEDGSWFVQTRALGFQPWFDVGFPHLHNQFISSAGTNWATMALALALPESKTKSASASPKPSPLDRKLEPAGGQ